MSVCVVGGRGGKDEALTLVWVGVQECEWEGGGKDDALTLVWEGGWEGGCVGRGEGQVVTKFVG